MTLILVWILERQAVRIGAQLRVLFCGGLSGSASMKQDVFVYGPAGVEPGSNDRDTHYSCANPLING